MAAVVLVSPSLHSPFITKMAATSRRQPLMSIPNATNSPHRPLTNSGSKRPRAVANVSNQENEPPSKRQALEKAGRLGNPVTPRRQGHVESAEGKVFERGNGEPVNDFQKRLVAARGRGGVPPRSTRSQASTTSKDVESIRQWQRHYRKLFPSFRIYFDSVPDDLKSRFIRQIHQLGANEETFFSKMATHIVTSRTWADTETITKALDRNSNTINPSLLELKGGKSNTRKDTLSMNDVLVRGHQMGLKIWTTDKLQKMLTTLFDDKMGHEHTTNNTRLGNDLVQVLKNEKLAAAAEKQSSGIPKEFIAFKGPFLYVHDMDEKFRPTMMREYAKVARRTDGDWPQFRSVSAGKCPFVEDLAMKRELEKERTQEEAQRKSAQLRREREFRYGQRTATPRFVDPARMNPPRRTSPRKVLRDVNQVPRPVQQVEPKQAPAAIFERQSSFPPMPEQPPVQFVKPSQMHLIREPAASGIQRSAMTSAIQSQMISSAAATGMKASTSKEVNELKRKVLERTHTGSLSLGSISSSHQIATLGSMNHARAPAPQRAAKSRAQEKLGGIQEETDPYADDLEAQRQAYAASKKKKMTKRDPKPGYCENCHDKYDDFEDHILTRKHRKFAMTTSNWEELDALLAKLQAP